MGKSIFCIKASQKKHRKYHKVGPTFYTLSVLYYVSPRRMKKEKKHQGYTSGLLIHSGLNRNCYAAFAPTYYSASGRCQVDLGHLFPYFFRNILPNSFGNRALRYVEFIFHKHNVKYVMTNLFFLLGLNLNL